MNKNKIVNQTVIHRLVIVVCLNSLTLTLHTGTKVPHKIILLLTCTFFLLFFFPPKNNPLQFPFVNVCVCKESQVEQRHNPQKIEKKKTLFLTVFIDGLIYGQIIFLLFVIYICNNYHIYNSPPSLFTFSSSSLLYTFLLFYFAFSLRTYQLSEEFKK